MTSIHPATGAGVASGIAQGLGKLAGNAAVPFKSTLSSFLSGFTGSDPLTGMSGSESFYELFKMQARLQQQQQQFTMLTNISKTEHETRMAAVRALRS